jgi:hypothetical protein
MSDSAPPGAELPRSTFVAVVVVSSALLAVLCWRVFLFWDDFVFLGEARDADLTWGYLTEPLFKHFSPVVRLLNLAVVDAVPGHPWVVPAVLLALLVGVVSSVTWLMVVLYGRTWPALVGSVLLAPSLTLLPLGNWWTGGGNILPALCGFYVAFAAMVLVQAGRSRWWALACFAGAALGVLAYELPMLLSGYLVLWYLLFGRRVSSVPWRAALRRTWWVWGGVIAIGMAAAVNYRLNYYDEIARPGLGDMVHATARSLVRTLVPTLLGFHDPRTDWFSTLSLVVGVVALAALVGWLLLTREQAWRGLVFAAAGWLLPTLALVLNRVGLYGVAVVDNAIYFHLPTALFLIGVLEAVVAPRRRGARRVELAHGPQRAAAATLAVVLVAAYAWSAGPTSRYQLPQGASPSYIDRARASAATLHDQLGSFTVINSDAPGSVVPGAFKPFNRANRVLGLTVPGLSFDRPAPPYVRMGPDGALVPVTVDWLVTVRSSDAGGFRVVGAAEPSSRSSRGRCFVADAETAVVWRLPRPVEATDVVLGTEAEVDATTTVLVTVRPDPSAAFDRANDDVHVLTPATKGVLDTVAAASIETVRVKGFTPGVEVCVHSLAVGVVQPTG